ncbi:hypothetical protein [Sulfurospirillum barnesii]|uniref:hypothetical protein n=1 Tax=Sulfurospirillum barnesii TaxID=44674 RepID=UPI001FDA1340|nr:hypothetical protein [Sulfurospirillum barnesii]
MGLFLSRLLHQDIEMSLDIPEYTSSKIPQINAPSNPNVWIKEMAQKDSRDFIFPVNELFMQIDLAKELGGNGKMKSFRLVIDRADRYSLFCIIQTLTSLHLPYMVIKEDKAPIIFVEEKSIKKLEGVVLELEKYDIKSKIVEVWL